MREMEHSLLCEKSIQKQMIKGEIEA